MGFLPSNILFFISQLLDSHFHCSEFDFKTPCKTFSKSLAAIIAVVRLYDCGFGKLSVKLSGTPGNVAGWPFTSTLSDGPLSLRQTRLSLLKL